MRSLRHALAVAAIVISAVPSFPAEIKVLPGSDGKQRVVMENNLIHLQFDPSRGARVDSFQFPDVSGWGNIEIIQDKRQQGLFDDHFWQEYWPGQFWEARYDYQILSQGPDEVSVKFSCLSQDKGIAQVAGILLEKTITLKENDRVVAANIRLTNKSSEGKYVGYWMQNVCWLGGDLKGDLYFRPTKRGISQTSSDDTNPPDQGFVREPQAGWSAAIDARTKTGLVFFMDYNYLWFLYNCTGASTIEWQYDAVAIPPGKSWQTKVSLVPVSKLGTVSYASNNLLAGVAFKEDKANDKLQIAQTYLATVNPLKSLEVQTGLETLLSNQKQTAAQPERIDNLGVEPQTFTVALPYDTKKRDPAVVRLTFKGTTATGDAFSEETELWYPGSFVSNTNPADGSPFYSIKSPPREKTLIKPDRIARIVKDQPQVLFLKGLLSPEYKLEPAIKKLSPATNIKQGYAYIGVFGPQLDFFPYDYDTLMSYDLVIVGDLSATCLGDAAMEMLKDYCEHGGNLLVLAGPFAYGNGGYKGTVMDTVLPVLSQGPIDLRPAKGDMKTTLPREVIKSRAVHHLKPEYLHHVKPKPEAKVLIACGDWPVVVSGQYGAGRICCIIGTPMGKRSYCDAKEWQEVMRYVLTDMGLAR